MCKNEIVDTMVCRSSNCHTAPPYGPGWMGADCCWCVCCFVHCRDEYTEESLRLLHIFPHVLVATQRPWLQLEPTLTLGLNDAALMMAFGM